MFMRAQYIQQFGIDPEKESEVSVDCCDGCGQPFAHDNGDVFHTVVHYAERPNRQRVERFHKHCRVPEEPIHENATWTWIDYNIDPYGVMLQYDERNMLILD